MIINNNKGNFEFINLLRKFNIVIVGCCDNLVYVEINDIVFIFVYKNDKFGFNVLVGGFFFVKWCEIVIFLDIWVEFN